MKKLNSNHNSAQVNKAQMSLLISFRVMLAGGFLLCSCQTPSGDIKPQKKNTAVVGSKVFSSANNIEAPRADNKAQKASSDDFPPPRIRLETRTNNKYGSYITDSEGRALYVFDRDKKKASTCYAACARAWPPLLPHGHEVKVSDDLSKKKVGEIKRLDETIQVSYNDYALYYYYPDAKAGDITGQGVDDHGAKWYLLSPAGKKIEATQEDQKSNTEAK